MILQGINSTLLILATNIAVLAELGLYLLSIAALKSCHLLDSFIKLKV
jgi:hypothetical protein